jgi:hypothetical protein
VRAIEHAATVTYDCFCRGLPEPLRMVDQMNLKDVRPRDTLDPLTHAPRSLELALVDQRLIGERDAPTAS